MTKCHQLSRCEDCGQAASFDVTQFGGPTAAVCVSHVGPAIGQVLHPADGGAARTPEAAAAPSPGGVDAQAPDFAGRGGSNDHRSVGPHRAWCHGCAGWCYPRSLCGCCAYAQPPVDVRLSFAEPASADDPNPKVEDYTGKVSVGVLWNLIDEWDLQ